MVCLPLIAERNAHEICLTQECLQIVRRLLWKQTTTHSIRNKNAMFEQQPLCQFKGPSQYVIAIMHNTSIVVWKACVHTIPYCVTECCHNRTINFYKLVPKGRKSRKGFRFTVEYHYHVWGLFHMCPIFSCWHASNVSVCQDSLLSAITHLSGL